MNRCRPNDAVWVFSLLLSALLLSVITDGANANDSVIVVDAVSVLAGGTTAGESDAVPVLLSDIEFEAFLILASRDRQNGMSKKLTTKDWRQAKERAVVIRLLAAQARGLHESASDDDKKALKNEIIDRMGGDASMNRFLARIGMEQGAVDRWIENAALAIGQIRFIKDQTVMPSDRSGQQTDKSGPTSDTAENASVPKEYRRMIGREIDGDELRRRLIEIVQNNHIRVLR